MKFFIIIFMVVSLFSCGIKEQLDSEKGTPIKPDTESSVKLEKMFTVDGCTVYRFYTWEDGWTYFITGNGQWVKMHDQVGG